MKPLRKPPLLTGGAAAPVSVFFLHTAAKCPYGLTMGTQSAL